MSNNNIEVRVLESAEYPLWDSFVESSPQGTIFATSLWAEIAGETTGLSHAIYGCFKGRELVGGTSVFYRSVGPFRVTVVPPLTRYTGVLVRNPDATPAIRHLTLEERVFEALSARLTKDFHRVVLSTHFSSKDIRPAQRLGWREHSLYTYLSDLSDIERLWSSIDAEAKRQIRKAEESGMSVRECSDVHAFHLLHNRTFAAQGLTPPAGEEAIRTVYERLRERDRCKMFFAEDGDGNLCAATFVVWDARRAYYLLGASDRSRRSSAAFSLLFWRMFQDLATRVAEMDLFGANIPSIAMFKKDFATQLALYHELKMYSFPLLAPMEAVRSAVSKVRWRKATGLIPRAIRLAGR